MPTGSGKTLIFSYILDAMSRRGKRGMVVVRGRSLVSQASIRLRDAGVKHGVWMAGEKESAEENIFVCSIDTIARRKITPEADCIIIDETHLALGKNYRWLLDAYPNAYVIGVTATPWADIKHVAEKIIYPISMKDLIKDKYLVDAKYFVPGKFDTSNIKIIAGEFEESSALVEFEKQAIYGNVIDSYKKLCADGPSFCFAINVAHARLLEQHFNNAGIKAVTITADTPLGERDFILKNLALGEISVVVSVGTMTTGVDVPSLKNIIMARPTQSKNLYTQMLGRGTRIHPGKDFFRVLDHVGNVTRHGFIIDESAASFDQMKKKKKADAETIKIKTCDVCFASVKAHVRSCPHCGFQFVVDSILPEDLENELIEIDTLDVKNRIRIRCKFHLYHSWANGYKPGYIWVQLASEFSEESLREHYQPYRNAKKKYEEWLNGTTSAPCAFAAFKNQFQSKYKGMEANDWDSI